MSPSPASNACAVIQGANRGLGLGLTRAWLDAGWDVVATCRRPDDASELVDLRRRHDERLRILRLDVTDEGSIERAADEVRQTGRRVGVLMNVAGILHGKGLSPEKKLGHVDPGQLRRVFEVNAFGPLLVVKHFEDLLVKPGRTVVANISARVGSIGDNRLGGWYAYRGSKAAQNMFTKDIAIELARRSKDVVVVALHPGTVDTNLSKRFQRGVLEHQLFTVEMATQRLMRIIDDLTPEDSGRFFAHDGSEIPW